MLYIPRGKEDGEREKDKRCLGIWLGSSYGSGVANYRIRPRFWTVGFQMKIRVPFLIRLGFLKSLKYGKPAIVGRRTQDIEMFQGP